MEISQLKFWTTTEVKTAIDMYKDGYSIKRISEKIGRSQSAVSSLIHNKNVRETMDKSIAPHLKRRSNLNVKA
jgi:predicted transcriptional regulator